MTNRSFFILCFALASGMSSVAFGASRHHRVHDRHPVPIPSQRAVPPKPEENTAQSLVGQFIINNLRLNENDKASVLLSDSLDARLKKLDEHWEDSEEIKQQAINGIFSSDTYEPLADIVRAVQRTSYNNSAVLGEAGVGKTHLTQALVAMFSFGLMPEDFKQKIRYDDDVTTPRGKMFHSIFGNTDLVLVSNYLLGLSDAERKQAANDTEARMRSTLVELFNAARREYLRTDANGKRIGRRTIFVFEEIATLPELVNETLKPLLDHTGYHDVDRTDLLQEDPGYSAISFTTFDEWRKMVNGDSAIERRYRKTRLYQPTEEVALNIVRGQAKKEWEGQYGIKIEDSAISFLIANRKFLGNPPLAMPASVLAATNDLFTWKGIQDGGNSEVITTQDVQKFLMETVGITSIWFEGPNGEPAFHDLEAQVQAQVVGHTEVIHSICQIIKTWAKFGMKGEPPLIVLGGPSGSGKDTILAAFNRVLFGHDGKKLNFSLAGAKGFGVDAFLEGPPVGNHSDHSIGLLAQALDQEKMGIIGLNEGHNLPSSEFEKFKVMVENGEIRPKGNDVRARPLLFPLFLMGQWGEEIFEGKTDEEIEAIDNALTQEQIEAFFLKGKKDGAEGAMPYALLERAKKSGGVFVIRPVKKSDYEKVVALNTSSMVKQAKQSSNGVELTVDPTLVKYAAEFSKARSSSTRGLSANLSDFSLGALNRANDDGLDLHDAKVNLRHEQDANTREDQVVVEWTNAPEGTRTFRLPAQSLYRHGARCTGPLKTLAGLAGN
jgi:hypothetical protein